ANHTGEQAISSVSGLQSALDAKAGSDDIPTTTETLDDAPNKRFVTDEQRASIEDFPVQIASKAGAADIPEIARIALSNVSAMGAGIWMDALGAYLSSVTLDGNGHLVEALYLDQTGQLKKYKAVGGLPVVEDWVQVEAEPVFPGLWIEGYGYAVEATLEKSTGHVVSATVRDAQGTIVRLSAQGGLSLVEIKGQISTRGRIWLEPHGYAHSVELDGNGYVTQASYVDASGSLIALVVRKGQDLARSDQITTMEAHPGYRYARSPNNKLPAAFWPAEGNVIYFFIVWGQSYAQGSNADVNDLPVSGLTPYPDNLFMFGIEGEDHGYIRPFDGSSEPLPVDRFVPLEERLHEGTKETICSGLGETLYEAITANLPDADPKFLFATIGSGGARYEGLHRGSRFLGKELPRLLTAATEIAERDGMRVQPILIVQHGEADNFERPVESYAEMLKQLRRHVDEDARKICGTSDPLLCFVNQCNRGATNTAGRGFRKVTTAPAALLAAQGDPFIFAASGLYATEPDAAPTEEGGGSHPSALGYRRAGELLAPHVWAQLGHVGTPVLRITEAQRLTETEVIFRCNDLVMVDTSGDVVGTDGIADNGGIWVQDGSTTNLSVTALENVDDETYVAAASGTTKTLKATLSAAPVGYALEWFYATNSTGPSEGNEEGARGLLRRPQAWGLIGDGVTDDITVPFVSRITEGDQRVLSWCAVDQGIIHS
ncbi:hypothetical protein, partial [Shimia sp.]|uniref:hypothetical protein n=1 Tax=Shimia sp. TaxID=1954381 RepID=UPI003B8BF2BB